VLKANTLAVIDAMLLTPWLCIY